MTKIIITIIIMKMEIIIKIISNLFQINMIKIMIKIIIMNINQIINMIKRQILKILIKEEKKTNIIGNMINQIRMNKK